MLPVPTTVPVVTPAIDTGGTLGAVAEAGLGEVSLGPVVPATSEVAAASVGLEAAAGMVGSSIGSGSGGVGVPPLGGLPEEPVPLLELEPLLVLSAI